MPKVKPETSPARRDEILEAAEICFARQGFHQTTIRDVLRPRRFRRSGQTIRQRRDENAVHGELGRPGRDVAPTGYRSPRRLAGVLGRRHARPCAGHPRLACLKRSKTWMAGTKPGHDEK
jgi:hypothetical protein